MPCDAPTIRLSEPQREILESITRRGTNPQQLVRRARIILLSDKGACLRSSVVCRTNSGVTQ